MREFWFLLLWLGLSGPCARASESLVKTVRGQIYHFSAGTFFLVREEVGLGYWVLFRLQGEDALSKKLVAETEHAGEYFVKARFHKRQFMSGDRRCSLAEVREIFTATGEAALQVGENDLGEGDRRLHRLIISDPLIIFAQELETVPLEDARLHARAADYFTLLRDVHALERIRRAPGGEAAIVAIRKLTLADLLFANFPIARRALGSPQLEDLLDAGAELWARGAHGILGALERKMIDHFEYRVHHKDEECAELLEHFGPDDLQVLDLKHRFTRALEKIDHGGESELE